MKRTIGVLALQGGFASHIAVLEKLGAVVREIRTPEELAGCDGFVIPGGESTVMTKLMLASGSGFHAAIRAFAGQYPVMGTCAGLIMLARPCGDERVTSLDVLPVSVERNSYGRQTESFIQSIQLSFPRRERTDNEALYPATFIRAPRIVSVGEGVLVLARATRTSAGISVKKETDMDPVMVQYGRILGLTFHPELTPGDSRIHAYFLSL